MTFALVTFIGGIFADEPRRVQPAQPTPAVDQLRTLPAIVVAPESPLPPGPCSTDLTVSVLEPQWGVQGNVARFIWQADRKLPSTCSYQIMLRHINGDFFDLLRYRPVVATTNGYAMDVYYAEDLPRIQQYPGQFLVTFELVDSNGNVKTIPVKSAPRLFFWLNP